MAPTKVMRPHQHLYRAGLHDMLKWMCSKTRLNRLNMVEIGTYLGESAAIFAQYFHHVWTVDPWDIEFMRSVSTNPHLTRVDILYQYAQNTKDLPNINHIEEPSLLAARRFADRSLSFVYIDGWHRVIPCTVDILTWLPKIDQGWIAGHDYTTRDYSEVIPATMYTLGRPDKVFPDDSWIKEITQ